MAQRIKSWFFHGSCLSVLADAAGLVHPADFGLPLAHMHPEEIGLQLCAYVQAEVSTHADRGYALERWRAWLQWPFDRIWDARHALEYHTSEPCVPAPRPLDSTWEKLSETQFFADSAEGNWEKLDDYVMARRPSGQGMITSTEENWDYILDQPISYCATLIIEPHIIAVAHGPTEEIARDVAATKAVRYNWCADTIDISSALV
jgi:hypothetical protein